MLSVNEMGELRNCDYEIKEQDRYLPIANVTRVMKKALPPSAKLSKEARECVQECASEFISFVTSQAMDRCLLEKRKTLNGEDLLHAMFSLGFEHYSELLKIYLAKYRQMEQQMEQQKRGKLSPEVIFNEQSESEMLDELEFGELEFGDFAEFGNESIA